MRDEIIRKPSRTSYERPCGRKAESSTVSNGLLLEIGRKVDRRVQLGHRYVDRIDVDRDARVSRVGRVLLDVFQQRLESCLVRKRTSMTISSF